MPGNDADTRLLFHFDGLPGSFPADDAVGGADKSITNTAAVSWAQSRFGNGSLYCDGTGGHLSIAPPQQDWLFLADDFTVDFWAYVLTPAKAFLLAWYFDPDNLLALEYVGSTGSSVEFRLRYRIGGAPDRWVAASATQQKIDVVGAWHHFAFVRSGLNIYLFIDGTLYASTTLGSAGEVISCNWLTLYLGKSLSPASGALQACHGYLDEVRIHMQAVWTSDFTPPTQAYHPVSELKAPGGYARRRSGALKSLGHHYRGVSGFQLAASGTFSLVRRAALSATGSHARYRPGSLEASGSYGRGIRAFAVNCSGHHARRRRSSIECRGSHGRYAYTFGLKARGTYGRRRRQRLEASGSHRRDRRYGLTALGSYGLEGPGWVYELFHALGATPDVDAAPFETFTSLPHTTAPISGAGVHEFILRRRNKWNLSSLNVFTYKLELDANDNEIALRPSAPVQVAITPGAAAAVQVTAVYAYNADGALQADDWLIYIRSDGSDPDPSVDTPVVAAIVKAAGLARLEWDSPGYSEGATVKALVRTRRTSDGRESLSSAIVSTTATGVGPGAPSSIKAFHRVREALEELA